MEQKKTDFTERPLEHQWIISQLRIKVHPRICFSQEKTHGRFSGTHPWLNSFYVKFRAAILLTIN